MQIFFSHGKRHSLQAHGQGRFQSFTAMSCDSSETYLISIQDEQKNTEEYLTTDKVDTGAPKRDKIVFRVCLFSVSLFINHF